jgi:hypothetical protein
VKVVLNSRHTGNGVNDPRMFYLAGNAGDSTGNLYNRWFSMTYNSLSNTNSPSRSYFSVNNPDYATDAHAHSGFLASPFNLQISQGTARDERIGDDINIIKDQWKFVVSIPKFWPDSTSGYWVTNSHVSNQRFIKVRCVGLLQDLLRPSGRLGYDPTSLFEDPLDLYSKFKYNGAKGYKVVFDQIKSFGLCAADEDQQSAVKQHVQFKVDLAYLKRYTPGIGGEVPSTDVNPTSGTAKGAVTWYFYIYDEGDALVDITQSASDRLRDCVNNPRRALIEVYRDTYYTDP